MARLCLLRKDKGADAIRQTPAILQRHRRIGPVGPCPLFRLHFTTDREA